MFPVRPLVAESDKSVSVIRLAAQEPALQSFLLRRADNIEDGHISQISIARSSASRGDQQFYNIAFADDDGEEAGLSEYVWVDFGSLGSELNRETIQETYVNGSGVLNFAEPLTNHTPLLSGFSFVRPYGGDQHLRELAIIPTRGGYSIQFRDDSPSDDTYSAGVNVVFIPNENVVGRHSQHFERANGSLDVPRESGQAVICGFSFKYLDSDHHIRHLQVSVSNDRIQMAMHDNDQNRAFEATIHYAIIRE